MDWKYALLAVALAACFVCGMLTQRACTSRPASVTARDTVRIAGDTITRTAVIRRYAVRTDTLLITEQVEDTRRADSLRRLMWDAFDRLALYEWTVAEMDTTLLRHATVGGRETYFEERWSVSYAFPPANKFTLIPRADPVPIEVDVPPCTHNRGLLDRFGYGPVLGIGMAYSPRDPYGRLVAAPFLGIGVFIDISHKKE